MLDSAERVKLFEGSIGSMDSPVLQCLLVDLAVATITDLSKVAVVLSLIAVTAFAVTSHKHHGVPSAAPSVPVVDVDFDYTSNAVQILKLIGDDIGLRRAETTWKELIRKAKEKILGEMVDGSLRLNL